MSTTTTTLGTCPDCQTAIPPVRLLLEYERSDGPAMYAECPDCLDVVRPA